jgi:uncharacterized protein
MPTSTDPFDALLSPLRPRQPRPQFAVALRRRLEEESAMTTTTVHAPKMFHIGVGDADRANAFYGAVFDWDTERFEDDDHVRYYVLNPGGSTPVLTGQPGAPNARLGFAMEAFDDAVQAVEALGGTVERRGGGWAECRDDQGVPMILWQANDRQHPSSSRPPAGVLEWFEVRVPSASAAATFYRGLLGWEPAGIVVAPGEPAMVRPYATVSDIDAVRALVVEHGGEAGPIVDMGPGIGCECTDDQGTLFGLWQRTETTTIA